jgi:hypothetical protein
MKRESNESQTNLSADVTHHTFDAASLIKVLDNTENNFRESNRQNEVLREEIKELTIAKQTDEAIVTRLSQALDSEIARGRIIDDQYQSNLRRLQAETEFHRSQMESILADNEQLRSYIVRMENDWNPVYDEEYYIQRFQEIKTDIEMWVASHAGKGLGKLSETSLLQILSRVGDEGMKSSEFLKASHETRILFKEPQLRIPFIRHIIAAFLLHQIFKPFTFGLHPEISHVLEYIQADIMSHGSLFKTIN